MHSRWYNTAVILAWLVTMTWLVKEKVLPPLLFGDPPSFNRIIESQQGSPPVGWKIWADNQLLGWALADVKVQPNGLTEIHGRVHFDTLPLAKLMSGWMESLVYLLGKPADDLEMDVRSLLVLDSFGQPNRFDSTVCLEPIHEVFWVRGTVEDHRLRLVIRAGDVMLPSYQAPLPSSSLLKDMLTPQTQLPGLRLGQSWTVPVYCSLPTKSPLEIMRATVEGAEKIYWNGHMEDAWLVVYRDESGNPGVASQAVRGRLWVRRDGAVLQQQAELFNITVTFVRQSDKEAEAQVAAAGEQWWVSVEDAPRSSSR